MKKYIFKTLENKIKILIIQEVKKYKNRLYKIYLNFSGGKQEFILLQKVILKLNNNSMYNNIIYILESKIIILILQRVTIII